METITSNSIYAIGLPIAFLLITIEAIYSAYKNHGLYNLGDSWGSLGLFGGNMIMVLLTKGLIFSFYLFLFQYNIFNLSEFLPIWSVWLLAFILIDFVYYWYHRASHRVRLLWAIHMNHHSSEEMNLLVAFRQAWFGPISKVPFFFVLPLFILDPTITLVAGAASTMFGVLGHTQIVKKLGPLELAFITPSHHRVHHGCNDEYLDKNYGNLLIIWDKLFGTFQKEEARVIYGIKENVNTFNPIKITFRDWKTLAKDMKASKSLRESFQYMINPPGWKPPPDA